MITLYNHAYTFAFSIDAADPSGESIPASDLRTAITTRLNALSDSELLENLGAPFDTYLITTPRYEVQHHTLCDGWVNTWTVDDRPQTFATEADAQAALDEFLREITEEIEYGEREEHAGYDAAEFRIMAV